jgi:anti-anti-sigma factor
MKIEPFRVEVERQGEALVVRPVGELDLATVSELDRAIGDAGAAPLLVLDLSGLEFLDTSGMRFLLKTQADSFALDRELKLVRGQREVQRLFAVAGFADRLQVEDTVEAALGSSADA